MPITPETSFHYESKAQKTEMSGRSRRSHAMAGWEAITQVKSKELVKPLISEGGRIVIDFAGLKYLGSMGLGALVGLKVSAINKGMCKLELVNLSPRVRELLSLTNLTELFFR